MRFAIREHGRQGVAFLTRIRMPPFTLVAETLGPPPLIAALRRWFPPSATRTPKSSSISMPPLTTDASTFILALAGRASRTPPFVVARTTSPPIEARSTRTPPLTVSAMSDPARFSPVMPPFVVSR